MYWFFLLHPCIVVDANKLTWRRASNAKVCSQNGQNQYPSEGITLMLSLHHPSFHLQLGRHVAGLEGRTRSNQFGQNVKNIIK